MTSHGTWSDINYWSSNNNKLPQDSTGTVASSIYQLKVFLFSSTRSNTFNTKTNYSRNNNNRVVGVNDNLARLKMGSNS